MPRWLKRISIVLAILVIAFGAAQLVRPERTNPATKPGHTIQAQIGSHHALIGVLDRSCRDCHSNETRWQSYTQVAPISWAIAAAVNKGRDALNFSEWGAYSPEQRQALLLASCEDASHGKMPGSLFAYLRPEARLSPKDIQTICLAPHQASAAR
jgi:hypothetical protein